MISKHLRIWTILLTIVICFAMLATFQYLFAGQQQEAPLFDNLGPFHRKISTKNPLAQRYFDQGLVLFYSFEYGESIRSFRAAVRVDPKCAMCHWGLSLALGSKTDAPLDGLELKEAKTAIKLAADLADPNNVYERAYIAALTRRYLTVSPQRLSQIAGLCSSYSQVSGNNAKDYAIEMRKVMQLFPNDADAKTLYAAALFDVTEWNFWNHVNGQPKPYTLEIIHTLELALKTDKNHPGANHLYVHIIEFSPHPKRALPSANRLNHLVPGSEHMAHMACHTYFSLGRYHDATVANQLAINIYKKYAADCRAQGFEPELQYLYYHNYDYLFAAASMEGRKKVSISAAQDLANLSVPLVKKNSFLQKWLTPTILALVRFGEWNAVLQIPKPNDNYQYVQGIWHYARGLAEIQHNQIEAANKELKQLKTIVNQGPVDKNLGNMGHGLLQIGANTLEGLLAGQSGNTKLMLEKLKAAIRIQDDISNSDPPSWYFPVRQLLGDALLGIGRAAEAEIIFRQDLKQNPKNGWSLFGLNKCLSQLGKKQQAYQVSEEFKEAWKYSDIPAPLSLIPLPSKRILQKQNKPEMD